jgi:hypothetical protein
MGVSARAADRGALKWSRLSLPLTVVVLFVGCGDGVATTAVQGSITFNGKPVTFGVINFKPAQGQPLGGEIRSDGTYQFELPPGEYQVRIDSPPKMPEGYKEGDPLPKLGPPQVPAQYANYGTSGLTATVGADSPQQLDFNLP